MAEHTPLWVTVMTAVFTGLLGAGGGVKVWASWIAYKTRGLELDTEKSGAAAQLEDTVYQRLEATLQKQIDAQAQTISGQDQKIEKHEERIADLERALRASHDQRGKMGLKIGQMQDRTELGLKQLSDLEAALLQGDCGRALLELAEARSFFAGVLDQTHDLGLMASEGSDPEEVTA